MHARPQGKLLIAALLGNGVKTVLCYDAKRVGRTQPAFWSFIGLCRDNGISVIDAAGTDFSGSVLGGVNGMLAEMDRDATVARLTAGKAHWRGQKRVDGRWPYGEHPSHEYDGERAVVARIRDMKATGVSSYAIAQTLNAAGIRTRYGKTFTTKGVQNILARVKETGVPTIDRIVRAIKEDQLIVKEHTENVADLLAISKEIGRSKPQKR